LWNEFVVDSGVGDKPVDLLGEEVLVQPYRL